MRITLHHGLGFPATQPLQLMFRCTRLPMPCGKAVPQVMPPKILNLGPQKGIGPCLGVDLDDWISLARENMSRVIALPPLKADLFLLPPVFRRFIF